MKNKLLFLLFLLTASGAIAQTLENTYSLSADESTLTNHRLSSTETAYAHWNAKAKTLSVYNTAHALIKTIVAAIPDTFSVASDVSRKLFNNNDSIEFIVGYARALYIINEDGSVKFQEGVPNNKSTLYYQMLSTDLGTKLMIGHKDYDTASKTTAYSYKIYDLEGDLVLGKKEADLKGAKRNGYPNPSMSYIVIPNQGTQSVLSIYSMNGQLIDELKITGDYTYNTTALRFGMYIYNLNGEYAGKFVKE
ncbi:MAG: T9SS type A sorting domain-containing protein [Bacteroidota bacterium]